jgi:hypothetical protein
MPLKVRIGFIRVKHKIMSESNGNPPNKSPDHNPLPFSDLPLKDIPLGEIQLRVLAQKNSGFKDAGQDPVPTEKELGADETVPQKSPYTQPLD